VGEDVGEDGSDNGRFVLVLAEGGGVEGRDGGVIGRDEGVIERDEGVIGRDEGVIGRDEGVIERDEGVIGRDGGVIGRGSISKSDESESGSGHLKVNSYPSAVASTD
jgi:hypothetical protein